MTSSGKGIVVKMQRMELELRCGICSELMVFVSEPKDNLINFGFVLNICNNYLRLHR